MYIPIEIRKLTNHEKPKKDRMGMSGSRVYMYPSFALKIHEIKDGTLLKEYRTLAWLEGKLPVPQVICYVEKKNYAYMLMNKLLGVMTCDKSQLDNPFEMISLLSKGLKMLWEVPFLDCPFDSTLKNKLKIAEKNVIEDDVDVTQSEEGTYGENGFKDPRALFDWLYLNQPKEELVFSHSDYCLPNVFIKDNQVVGFIDFDRAGIACKWADIALCVRSIEHNFGKNDAYNHYLFKELNLEPDWDKIRYYILLDELL
ncbi:MAG: aminoglycoside 3'-phosphotransferase [Acholeplasmataceae bacterium]|nr:aminoglycoside 3'-phosphotransferase [Acholeplasmataceae bacterium]